MCFSNLILIRLTSIETQCISSSLFLRYFFNFDYQESLNGKTHLVLSFSHLNYLSFKHLKVTNVKHFFVIKCVVSIGHTILIIKFEFCFPCLIFTGCLWKINTLMDFSFILSRIETGVSLLFAVHQNT